MSEPHPAARPGTAGRCVAWVLLVIYAVAALLIAFWPEPVDRGATGLLDRIERLIPWATYRRVEFGANVLFFVPLGWLLGVLLDRARYVVVPIALVTTVAIEGIQGELLSQRTASIYDVLANVTGACVGLILVSALTRRHRGP
ncbi:VanZ family protein [Microbacterium sp. P04]|uniref:VanZ family protein n=1 Tax=Microbacterium sp. P04 TaxID=3366947 RepID=UPI003744B4C1